MRARMIVFAAAASIAVLGLAGCGDQPQELTQRERQYQGKPDTAPWDNDPASALPPGSGWTKGNKTSWETALKARALNQNEYTRVE